MVLIYDDLQANRIRNAKSAVIKDVDKILNPYLSILPDAFMEREFARSIYKTVMHSKGHSFAALPNNLSVKIRQPTYWHNGVTFIKNAEYYETHLEIGLLKCVTIFRGSEKGFLGAYMWGVPKKISEDEYRNVETFVKTLLYSNS